MPQSMCLRQGAHPGSQTGLGMCHNLENHQPCELGKIYNLFEVGSPSRCGASTEDPSPGSCLGGALRRCQMGIDDKGTITTSLESVLIQDPQGAVGTSRGLPRGGGTEAKTYKARRSWPVIGVRNGEREFQAGGISMCKGLEVSKSLFSIPLSYWL